MVTAVLLVVVAARRRVAGSRRGDGSASTPDPTTASSGQTSGRFGTLDSPCGPGDATGATDQGVTDEAIRIGYGDDAGYQGSPGLDHQTSDAVEAFVAWCNEQGGINGRQVDATYYDAKVTEVTNVMTAACAEEFFLVGELFVFDDGQEPTRRECGLPAVPAAAGTARFANAPLKWEPMPSAIDRASVYGGVTLREMYPEKVKKAGVVYGDYAGHEGPEGPGGRGLHRPRVGVPARVCLRLQHRGEADWKPLIQRFKNCGAEVVYYVGAPAPSFENALRCRQPVGVPADLVRRHQRLRRVVRGLEQGRLRRQRVLPHGVRAVRGGRAGAGGPTVPRHRRGPRRGSEPDR